MSIQIWQKNFRFESNLDQSASYGPFWPKLWTSSLAPVFDEIFQKEKKNGEVIVMEYSTPLYRSVARTQI